MRIGELASRAGVAPSAIRFYEQSGLLPQPDRGANGYRSYPESALERLRFIHTAQSLGFPLDALRGAFASGAALTAEDVLQRIDDRLGEIDRLSATLRAQRRELVALRETLPATWAAGECVETLGPVQRVARAAAGGRARRGAGGR